MSALLARVREELRAAADPARAPQMQAYMKSAMPYYGVPMPAVRAICKKVFADHSFTSAAAFRKDALALFRGAGHREERYAAVMFTGHRGARPFQDLAALPMYEEMIVEGAWWDLVDELAADRIGALLRAFPREMKRTMRAWSKSENLWKRRTAILCQLRFKEDTDLPLLYACIEPALASKEFFLRKAIGWALRQYAWTDPDEVRRYVKEHESLLSGLSKREALKNVG